MNLKLKAVYFCATANRRWGKGYTVKEAKKNAGITGAGKGLEFYVQAAIFNDPSPEELENLCACITADQISGGPIYYRDDRSEEDTKMINDRQVGWLMIEKNY